MHVIFWYYCKKYFLLLNQILLCPKSYVYIWSKNPFLSTFGVVWGWILWLLCFQFQNLWVTLLQFFIQKLCFFRKLFQFSAHNISFPQCWDFLLIKHVNLSDDKHLVTIFGLGDRFYSLNPWPSRSWRKLRCRYLQFFKWTMARLQVLGVCLGIFSWLICCKFNL